MRYYYREFISITWNSRRANYEIIDSHTSDKIAETMRLDWAIKIVDLLNKS